MALIQKGITNRGIVDELFFNDFEIVEDDNEELLNINTNNNQIMTFKTDGKVGIGITNPNTVPLEIYNDTISGVLLKNQNNTIGAGLTMGSNGDLNVVQGNADDNINIITNGNTRLFISKIGYIGIDNTNPTAPLSFSNVAGGNNKLISFYDGFNNDHQFFGFGRTPGVLRYQIPSTSDNHSFYAGTSSTTSTEIFRVQGNGEVVVPNGNLSASDNITAFNNVFVSNGRIGIGTTSPSTPLHMVDTNGDLLVLENTINNQRASIKLLTNGTDWELGARGSAASQSNSFYIYSGGNFRFLVEPQGHIGINKSDSLGGVHVKATNNTASGTLSGYNQTVLIMERSYDTNKWSLHINNPTNNNLCFTFNGQLRGYLLNSAYVDAIDFTGQHRARFSENNINKLNNINDYVGLIVCSTGNYINPIDINEALPFVELSTTSKDIRVFGVISNGEDTNSNQRTYQQGTFVSVVDIKENDHRAIINSVGEGSMWICDENGPIENGDYITTSNNTGYGMKQDDDIVHNYTVAKICQDEDFSDMTNGRILPNGVKCKFVGVTYHCG